MAARGAMELAIVAACTEQPSAQAWAQGEIARRTLERSQHQARIHGLRCFTCHRVRHYAQYCADEEAIGQYRQFDTEASYNMGDGATKQRRNYEMARRGFDCERGYKIASREERARTRQNHDDAQRARRERNINRWVAEDMLKHTGLSRT